MSITRPLYAFLDLSVSPVSYDFITFLVIAELARLESKSDGLRIVVVPADDTYFRNDPRQDSHYNADQKHWRVANIVLPACTLMPSCMSVHVCENRIEAQYIFDDVERRSLAVYPAAYSVAEPTQGWETKRSAYAAVQDKEIPSLCAPAQAVSYVASWMNARAQGHKVVSITLREADWQDERNSNLAEWVRFAHWLRQEGFIPVFLRDTTKVFDRTDDDIALFESFDAGSINIPIRTAFYEACYLNLFVSNGPAELAMFNGAVRYILYKACAPSEYKKDDHPQGATGLYTGRPLPFGTPYQVWDWGTDDFDVIQREFVRMAEAIDSSAGRAFERLSLKRPITVELQLVTAHLYRTHHQLEEARSLYDLLQGQLGHRVEYWLWLAEIKLFEGDPIRAKEAAIDALTMGTPTTADYGTAGDIALRCGDPNLAESYYRNILSREPETFETCVRLGISAMLRQGHEDATTWFEKSLVFAPNHPFVLDKLAQIAKESGNFSKAADLWLRNRSDVSN